MLHAWVLRSPHAHATIRSIDTTAASSSTGVVSVVTALDLAEAVRNVPTRGNIDADVLKPPPLRYWRDCETWSSAWYAGLAIPT